MIGRAWSNESIKTAVAVFGSLFNNIVIQRKDGTKVPVPIAYGPRDKWIEAQRVMKQEEEMFEKLLPFISYELVAMNYDQVRKLTNKQTVVGTHDGTKMIAQRIGAPVPYNLDFTMYIQTKNLNDGWQIVEQILPFFTPSYTVKVRNFPVDNDSETPIPTNTYDMPITLLAVTWADDFTGDIEQRRMIEWTLEFQTKIWIYGPPPYLGSSINTGKIILDSRAVISAPYKGNVADANRNDPTDQTGEEIGYVVVDSETLPVSYVTDSDISPNIINTLDTNGRIVKIIRDVNTFWEK